MGEAGRGAALRGAAHRGGRQRAPSAKPGACRATLWDIAAALTLLQEEFQANYAVFLAGVLAVALLFNPGSAAVRLPVSACALQGSDACFAPQIVGLLAAGWAVLLTHADVALVVRGRTVTRTEQLGLAAAASLGARPPGPLSATAPALGAPRPPRDHATAPPAATQRPHPLTHVLRAAVVLLFSQVAVILASAVAVATAAIAAHAALRSPDGAEAESGEADDAAERGQGTSPRSSASLRDS